MDKKRPPHYGTEYFLTPRIWFREFNGQPLWDQWSNPQYYQREDLGYCREYVAIEEMEAQLAELEKENEALRGVVRAIYKEASPGRSREDWNCFKLAQSAIEQLDKGK